MLAYSLPLPSEETRRRKRTARQQVLVYRQPHTNLTLVINMLFNIDNHPPTSCSNKTNKRANLERAPKVLTHFGWPQRCTYTGAHGFGAFEFRLARLSARFHMCQRSLSAHSQRRYGQFSSFQFAAFLIEVSNPRTIAYLHFKMPFECSNIPGADPFFQIELLKAGCTYVSLAHTHTHTLRAE